MTPSRPIPRLPVALAALALAAVMLVVPASAPLCASDLGVCVMPAAPPMEAPAHPTAEPHCPMAAAHGGSHGQAPDAPDMDCCVADAAPQGPVTPVPAVPAPAKKADAERQLQAPPALAPVALALGAPALPAPAPTASPPAADLAASPVPLYTLLSSLLS